MSDKDGGLAFPRAGSGYFKNLEDGMSLREWFAGQALIGIMQETSETPGWQERFAWRAYSIADAMLVEKVKRKENG